MTKQKLLIFTEYFLPATKGGGPVSSIRNLVELLHKDIEIRIICFNHDLNETRPLKNIESDKWNNWQNKAEVFYASGEFLSKKNIETLILDFAPDTIYLNAIFVYQFIAYPIWTAKRINAKVIIAPRGMFQKSALNQKKLKKSIYLKVLKTFVLNKNIVWHCTNNKEHDEIMDVVGFKNIVNISNVPVSPNKSIKTIDGDKITLVSVSLNTRMKNLHFFLQVLQNIEIEIEFHIYGPIKDREYWQQCEALIEEMPDNVKVDYKGEVAPDKVSEIIARYSLFVLPTLGENFGHAIFEAFACGVPVLISDKTPWRDLESKGIGFDLELNQSNWIETINSLKLDKLMSMRENSLFFAKDFYKNGDFTDKYLKLFK